MTHSKRRDGGGGLLVCAIFWMCVCDGVGVGVGGFLMPMGVVFCLVGYVVWLFCWLRSWMILLVVVLLFKWLLGLIVLGM